MISGWPTGGNRLKSYGRLSSQLEQYVSVVESARLLKPHVIRDPPATAGDRGWVSGDYLRCREGRAGCRLTVKGGAPEHAEDVC